MEIESKLSSASIKRVSALHKKANKKAYDILGTFHCFNYYEANCCLKSEVKKHGITRDLFSSYLVGEAVLRIYRYNTYIAATPSLQAF